MSMMTDLKMALDPVYFAREALHFSPFPAQELILRSQSDRLLLNCTRQFGKTTCVSILALHYALFHPDALILIIAKAERQAQELLRKVRDQGLLVPDVKYINESRTHLELQNNSRVISLPSSSSGIRGFSAPDLICADEAARIDNEMFIAIKPMLALGGSFYMLSTPAGKRGYFYTCWKEDASWEKHKVTIYDHPLVKPEFIEREKREMKRFFQSEYMCEFIDLEDATFNADAVQRLFTRDIKPLFTESLVSKEVKAL